MPQALSLLRMGSSFTPSLAVPQKYGQDKRARSFRIRAVPALASRELTIQTILNENTAIPSPGRLFHCQNHSAVLSLKKDNKQAVI